MSATASPDPGLALDAVLAPQGIRAVFQPVVDLGTGETVGYDANCRWSHLMHDG